MERENYKGLYYRIEQDDNPDNPRETFDHLAKMICFHRRYALGDKHNFSIEEAKELSKSKEVVSLPLYLYDHSGITMNTRGFSCPWDSGQVGFIYIDKKAMMKEWNKKRWSKSLERKAIELMEGEVKEYYQYLTGDVWGYVVEDEGGNHLDSCWGFYGNEYCEKEAKRSIDFMQKEIEGDLALRTVNI